MKSPEEIEKALHRLVPPALSARAHADVSSMLASLADSSISPTSLAADLSPQTRSRSHRITITLSTAAALVIAAITPRSFSSPDPAPLTVTTSKTSTSTAEDASPVLIDRMLVTDGVTLEGTVAAADGRVINQVHRRVETRERYRDAKKGYLITISETRDEKVYLPKKGF